MKQNQHIQLQDGRMLGYAEYGVETGTPVFYFHGGNGSRLEAEWFEQAALRQNIRLIAPDRPGFGLSDFQVNRQILDWVTDVCALADNLNINKFSIFGLSGGAPHILALVAPERINNAAIISGVAPISAKKRFHGMWFPVRMIFFLAKYFPSLNRLILKQQGKFYADKEMMRQRMMQALPEPDKQLLRQQPEILDIFARDAQEAHQNGIEGDAWEWQLYVADWGFELQDLGLPIALWYGEFDKHTPISMGEYYAHNIPNATLHRVSDGGHFSTINNHIDDILRYLKD